MFAEARFRLRIWWKTFVTGGLHDHDEGAEHPLCDGCKEEQLLRDYRELRRKARRS